MTWDAFTPRSSSQPQPGDPGTITNIYGTFRIGPNEPTSNVPGANTPPPSPTVPGIPGAPAITSTSFLGDLFGLNPSILAPQEIHPGLEWIPGTPILVTHNGNKASVTVAERRKGVEPGIPVGFIVPWTWVYYGSPGGLEKTYGDLERDADRLSSSSLIHTIPRFVHLPFKMNTAATPDPTGNAMLHWTECFNTLLFAIGSGNDVSFFKETAGGGVTAITGSGTAGQPGAVVSSLSSVISGAITNARRVIMGRVGSAPLLISDTSGTIAATMHTDLSSLWAAQQMTLTGLPIGYYAGTSLKYHLVSDTVTNAPSNTDPVFSLPAGGFNLGLISRGGSALRWHLAVPLTTNTSGGLVFGAEAAFKIIHLNQELTDIQEMSPQDFLGLKNIIRAVPYLDGVVVTDGKRIVFNNASTVQEYAWARDREADSNYEYRVRNLGVNGAQLIIEGNKIASANGTGDTIQFYETIDARTNAIQAESGQTTFSGVTGVQGVGATSIPISTQTNMIYGYSSGSWRYKFIPPYGLNGYTQFRNTILSGTTGYEMEASGRSKTPWKYFPRGLQGWPSVIAAIGGLGDYNSGTTTYTMGGVSAAFTGIGANKAEWKLFPNNDSFFYQAQLQIDIAQGSNANTSPNAVPVAFKGYTFIGVPPRPPAFVNVTQPGVDPVMAL